MNLCVKDVSRLLRLLAALLFAAVLVDGCGGGGSGSSSDPAKSSFTAGPITGFGSVIVNGIRFDVSSASVADDEEEVQNDRSLKLGMQVEVEAGEISANGGRSHGEARAIHFRSVIIGPVMAVDSTAKSLVVLGQPVDVTPTTVFDNRLPGGIDSIVVDDVVEVFGMLDKNTGRYTATRIEPKANAQFFKLRGVVSNLDTSARTFQIGGAAISYANLPANQIPGDLANGLLVYVKVQTVPDQSGAWVATKLKDAPPRHMKDHDEVEIKGLVTSVTSSTQFSVNGIPVDASNARFEPTGLSVAVGDQVEVEGAANNGIIIATKVSIESEEDDRINGFELHGAIESLDTSSMTFVLRGVTVSYSGAVFSRGTQSDLANGSQVEVKGTLSVDGTTVQATSISFEH